MEPPSLYQHSGDVFSFQFPLRFFGLDLGRRVTLLRIFRNRLVVHSTGPFAPDHIAKITELGSPDYMLDATTMHDTFSADGCAAFPGADYFIPEGFPKVACDCRTRPLEKLDDVSQGEVQTLRLKGMRFLNEYACFHPASRTLIVCDLLFNLDGARGYTRWAMRYLLGVKQWPAIDRPVRWSVYDHEAFRGSLQRILEWDFDRVIMAHGSVIEQGGKLAFVDAVNRAGFEV